LSKALSPDKRAAGPSSETPMTKTGFTIMEFLVVLVVIGVLATLGFAQYGTYRERTLDQEAQANLRLIVAAERIYRMEVGGYWARDTRDDINNGLRMLMPGANWGYRATTSCAEATRTVGGTTRRWSLNYATPDADPATTTCP
jgi:prepilin-type N-terminal cleavage/methylation domain-containing protein